MPKRALALYRTRRRWTEVEAREALAALAESGLSANAFATREGIDSQRLLWWRRRFASNNGPARGSFVEVTTRSFDAVRVEAVLLSGRILRFSPTIDPLALRVLVEVLEQETRC